MDLLLNSYFMYAAYFVQVIKIVWFILKKNDSYIKKYESYLKVWNKGLWEIF